MSEGHYAEAEKLYRETLGIRPPCPRAGASRHPQVDEQLGERSRWSEGNYAEAEKLYRETLDIHRRVLGPESPDTAISTYNLGCVAARRGRRDEALSFLREAVDHGLPRDVDLGIDKDPDLKSLHGDPRFDALVAYAKLRAAAAPK